MAKVTKRAAKFNRRHLKDEIKTRRSNKARRERGDRRATRGKGRRGLERPIKAGGSGGGGQNDAAAIDARNDEEDDFVELAQSDHFQGLESDDEGDGEGDDFPSDDDNPNLSSPGPLPATRRTKVESLVDLADKKDDQVRRLDRKTSRRLLKATLELWASVMSKDKERLDAFVALQRFAKIMLGDKAALQSLLKSVYLAFLRNCKLTTPYTLPGVTMMKNTAYQLFALDDNSSYQIAFGYIRQLAIHLRTCIQSKTEEAAQAVYNWQFVHSIELWTLVLVHHCDRTRIAETKSPMADLIYPLVQIIVGALRHMPSPRLFPFQCHLLGSLNLLAQKTSVYIPLVPHCLEILSSHELQRKPKPSTLKPVDLDLTLRIGQPYLSTKVYQEAIQEEVLYLLLDHFTISSLSIAFPELAIPPLVQLKRLVKNCKNPKFRQAMQALVDRIMDNSKFIEEKRKTVEFAPAHHDQVKAFLAEVDVGSTPLGVYLRVQKKQRDAKRAIIEASRLERTAVYDKDEGE